MKVEMNGSEICIDASLLAPLLDLPPDRITPLMRDGTITSVSERGVDADAGKLRLTFRYRNRRARVTINEAGEVLRRSRIDFGERPPSPHGNAEMIPGLGRLAGPIAAGATTPDAPADRAERSIDDVVQATAIAFRAHPHVGNVMTHISGARWDEVERALKTILDPHATCRDLSPLAENIVDLMCAERGTTGRILKPYFRGLLDRMLPQPVARRLRANVARLFDDMQIRRANPPRTSDSGGPQTPQEAASTTPKAERIVDVRGIAPRIRHTVILQLCEHLDRAGSLQLISDHRPEPLRLQLEAKHGARYAWTYLETGPDVWRIRLQRR